MSFAIGKNLVAILNSYPSSPNVCDFCLRSMKKLKAQLKRTIFLCGISYIGGWEVLLQMGKKFKNGNQAIGCEIFVASNIFVAIFKFAAIVAIFHTFLCYD